eukprot:8732303-Alexandrium_andersonii.AAC.1
MLRRARGLQSSGLGLWRAVLATGAESPLLSKALRRAHGHVGELARAPAISPSGVVGIGCEGLHE